MIVAVIGGNLQGVEATYLAQKAGWEVLLIDRRPAPPAAALCDRFVRFDVASVRETARVLRKVDLVVPALEDLDALGVLTACAGAGDILLAFDLAAYRVSCSKIRSNALFESLQIPVPAPWPGCRFPVTIKPDNASGSEGVRVVHQLADLPPDHDTPGKYVIQAYAPGPVYSLEVVGVPGAYRPLQVTALEMDDGFDCKRVMAPSGLNMAHTHTFEQMAVTLADALHLKGIMDLEVILNAGRLVLLEIDARLPSQTPSAVYWSTGLNMLSEIGALFLEAGRRPSMQTIRHPLHRSVIYEHIRICGQTMAVSGEHIMSGVTPLTVRTDFFGADEAITTYRSGSNDWVATLIFAESDHRRVQARRNDTISAIRRHCQIEKYMDNHPVIEKGRKG